MRSEHFNSSSVFRFESFTVDFCRATQQLVCNGEESEEGLSGGHSPNAGQGQNAVYTCCFSFHKASISNGTENRGA